MWIGTAVGEIEPERTGLIGAGGRMVGSSSSIASTPIMAALPGALLAMVAEEEEEAIGCMLRTTDEPPALNDAGRLPRLRRPIEEGRGCRNEWLAGLERPSPTNSDCWPA